MPVFEYKGLSIEGKDARGFIDAENLQSAKLKLRRSGIFPVEVSEETRKKAEGEPSAVRGLLRRVKKQETTVFPSISHPACSRPSPDGGIIRHD